MISAVNPGFTGFFIYFFDDHKIKRVTRRGEEALLFFSGARENFILIIMEAIEWIDNHLAQAEAMVYRGEVDEALNMLESLLFEEPGYAPLHNVIGWAYLYHIGNTARAELHFRAATRFASNYAPPCLHLGILLNRAGRYHEAIQFFRAGLRGQGAYLPALMEGIAQAYEMRQEYRLAIRAYREAATASVTDEEVNRMLSAARRCRRKRFVLMFSF